MDVILTNSPSGNFKLIKPASCFSTIDATSPVTHCGEPLACENDTLSAIVNANTKTIVTIFLVNVRASLKLRIESNISINFTIS